MLNHCTMMGRLTRNPEVRQTKGDEPKTVAKFGIAVERDYTVQGEKLTDFFEVETWQKTAEFVEKYLKKASLLHWTVSCAVPNGQSRKQARNGFPTT